MCRGTAIQALLIPVVKKCIFCYDTRLKYGKPPACVEVCPQEVLTFGNRNDLLKIGRDRIKEKPDRYVDHIYGEKEVGDELALPCRRDCRPGRL